MALTAFQRELCQLLAAQRLASGESYADAALNEILKAPRVSRDLDLFHDTAEALVKTFDADRHVLEGKGLELRVVRERPGFVEAEVRRGPDSVLLQWLQDSAFRFFPLVREEPFGLTLHPFDHATNKVLALVGRVEVRDWIDTLASSDRIQHLGYLAWAACGKDPGFSPTAVLEHAARSTRYSSEEVAALEFAGPPPDAGALARRWRVLLAEAHQVVAALPAEEVGRCVLRTDGSLYTSDASALAADLEHGRVRFHAGCIRGALPSLMANGGR